MGSRTAADRSALDRAEHEDVHDRREEEDEEVGRRQRDEHELEVEQGRDHDADRDDDHAGVGRPQDLAAGPSAGAAGSKLDVLQCVPAGRQKGIVLEQEQPAFPCGAAVVRHVSPVLIAPRLCEEGTKGRMHEQDDTNAKNDRRQQQFKTFQRRQERQEGQEAKEDKEDPGRQERGIAMKDAGAYSWSESTLFTIPGTNS